MNRKKELKKEIVYFTSGGKLVEAASVSYSWLHLWVGY